MPEEVSEKLGWRVAGEKKMQGQESKLRQTPVNGGPAAAEHRRPPRKNFKSKLLKAARMPVLPRQDIKIVMRPRGGLNVGEVSRFEISRAIVAAANVSGEKVNQDVICPNKQQNIVVVSTPKRENADRYSAVKSLTINGMAHEVSAYETAPNGTVKGVIKGVPLTDTIQEINDYIVQEYNQSAMQANRIGKTTTVVIAFEGDKVPNYIRYGNLLVECSLYRKKIDMCYRCGRLGHRMDVCPNPEDRICRGCGIKNPQKSHVCSNPTYSLCGATTSPWTRSAKQGSRRHTSFANGVGNVSNEKRCSSTSSRSSNRGGHRGSRQPGRHRTGVAAAPRQGEREARALPGHLRQLVLGGMNLVRGPSPRPSRAKAPRNRWAGQRGLPSLSTIAISPPFPPPPPPLPKTKSADTVWNSSK